MILRIQIKGNYLVGTENSLNDEIFRLHQSHVRYSRDRSDNFWFYDSTLNKLLGENTSLIDPTLEGQVFFPIADIRDSSGVAFASANVFETWLSTNTGKIFSVGGGGGGGVWGAITGTLSDQTDLQDELDAKEPDITATTSADYYRGDKTFQTLNKTAVGLSNVDNTTDLNKPISTANQTALDGKVDENASITGSTKTKITYDSKGLVTSGTDASLAELTDDATHRVVTDAQIATWNALIGGSIFQTTWNANTNTPALVSSVGTKGYYYIVDTNGTTSLDGISDWKVGDWAIFDGTVWRKVDNTDAVSSVNGLTGAVSLDSSNVPDTLNKRYITDAQLVVLGNTSGTNSGNETTSTLGATINGSVAALPNDIDLVTTVESSVVKKITWTNVKLFLKTYFDTVFQVIGNYFNKDTNDTDDITVGATNKFATASEKRTVGFITVSQAVDLDTIGSDTATNNAKVTNATHTGDATGSNALTVVKIQGKDFPTLAVGDDQKYPKYNHGTGSFIMTAVSGIIRTILNIATTTTGAAVASVDYTYLMTTTFTYTQPTAVGNTNRYTLKNSGVGIITINTTSSQTIDGATTIILNPEGSVDLISNNSNWFII